MTCVKYKIPIIKIVGQLADVKTYKCLPPENQIYKKKGEQKLSLQISVFNTSVESIPLAKNVCEISAQPFLIRFGVRAHR